MTRPLSHGSQINGLTTEGNGKRHPKVSVIVPICNEASFIERCLKAILANDYEADQVEVLVLDGLSTDGTEFLVAGIAERDHRVRLIQNPERMVSYAMNRGIREAVGDIIIRVDGHAIVPPNFIRLSVTTLQEHPEAWCAGGPVVTVSQSKVGTAIAEAMSSPIGVGNARFRIGHFEGPVDTIAFGAYWKHCFDKIGLFDEELVRNQDDELNLRVIRNGGIIYMNPRIQSKYYSRGSYAKLTKQYYQYGFWRIRVIQKHRRPATLRQLVPILFVLSAFALLLGAVFSHGARLALFGFATAYFGALLMGALMASREQGLGLVPRMIPAFMILHFGYGFGSLSGVLHFLIMRRSATAASNQGISR